MYRNIMITLPEENPRGREYPKLLHVPGYIRHTKHLTILNQCRMPGGFFWTDTVSQPHSYRILRWQLLENAADAMSSVFADSAFLKGARFHWDDRLGENQLSSFRWRHALALSIDQLGTILTKQAGSLQTLELSMIQPPTAAKVAALEIKIAGRNFPKLRKLTYDGLSHTEPIPQNSPEKGGRFRMLRPIFRKTYTTLEELSLSQDHCISQVGKTPLINGRTFDAFLCDLDELYIDPRRPNADAGASVSLNLTKLELGGFKVVNLFKSPSMATISPRVRIELPSLRRLVLNECDGLGQLLQDIRARKDEIKLTEVGFRIREDEEAFGDFYQLADTLKDFLLSFKGLKILSVLWDGPDAPTTATISSALTHHAETMQVYVHAARWNANEESDADPGSTLRFVSEPFVYTQWTPMFSPEKRPPLREIAVQLPAHVKSEHDALLRQLSQFELRTVHIRNFPPLCIGFWRDEEGSVSPTALITAANFAESIALPYYSTESIEKFSSGMPNKLDLQKLAEIHATRRDKNLGCTKLKALYSSSAPIRDISKQILLQRAVDDPQFGTIMHKVEKGRANADELDHYNQYVEKVQITLGVIPPTDQPKLRLLIVGDWRYRDQLNLSGPRNWDPSAWCTKQGDDLEMDEMSDPNDLIIDSYGGQRFEMRYGFKKEFDVSLLPIFFKVDWEAERGKDKKWRWRAKVSALKQTTLEGYGALGDVRALDFAFQN